MATKRAKMGVPAVAGFSFVGDVQPWSGGEVFAPEAPPPQEAQQQPSGTMRRVLGDGGLALMKGAVAVPEAAVGLADIVTGGRVGRALEEGVEVGGVRLGFRPREAKEALDTMLTPEQQKANQAVQEAQGFLDTTVAALRNPSTILSAAAESVPMMLGGGVIGRSLMRLAPAATPTARIGAAAAGEGIMAAGSQAESIRQETADGLLTGTQSAIAAGSGGLTGLLGMLGGAVARRMGIADVDTLLVGKADPQLTKGFARRVLEGAVAEGLLEELPQSVQEQVAQNLALNRPLGEGVPQAAVLGALAGGLMGGGANVFSPGAAVRQEKVPETGPASRAANAGLEATAKEADALQAAGAQIMAAAGQPAAPVAPVEQPQVDVSRGAEPAADAGSEAAIERMHQQAAREVQDVGKVWNEPRRDLPPPPPATVTDGPVSDANPEPEPGDILNAQGKPFTNRGAAVRKQNEQPDPAAVVIAKVRGGFALRPVAPKPAGDAGAPAVPAPEPTATSTAAPEIDAAAHQAASSPLNDLPEPTDAQKEAGNYKVGRVRISGMDVSIETPKGAERRSKADAPQPWNVTMPAHYGYIRGTEGADGDHVDLFVGDKGDNGRFWVINQHQPDKPEAFDEHKVITGVDSADEAVRVYKASFADGFGDKVFTSISKEHGADDLKALLPSLKKPKPVKAVAPAPAANPDPIAEYERGRAEAPRIAWEEEQGKRLGLESTSQGVGRRVGNLGDVIVSITSEPGTLPLRAEIHADYMGKRFATRAAEGDAAISAAVEEFAAKLQEGRERMAREKVANERGAPAPEQKPSLKGPSSASVPTVPPAPPPKADAAPAEVWAVSLPAERERVLLAAGWRKGSPGMAEMQGRAWDAMTPSQRGRIGKAIEADRAARAEPAAAPAPTPSAPAAAAPAPAAEPEDLQNEPAAKWWGVLKPGGTLIKEGRMQALRAVSLAPDLHNGTAWWHLGKDRRAKLRALFESGWQPTEADAPTPAPTAPVKRSKAAQAAADARRESLERYFAPGNIVKSYGGHDEVLALKINDDGGFSVHVHAVTKSQGSGQWVRLGKPQDARWHSTFPEARELKAGPVAQLLHLPGELVSYTEGRADGQPFKNAPDRGVKQAAAPAPAPTPDKAEIRPYRRADGSVGYEAVPIVPPAPPAASANTVFTEDAAERARARLKDKLNRLNSGIDPEMLMDGITLAGYHIEKGARTFAAYAKAMVGDLGDAVKPYLQSWYMAVRNDPRAAAFRADMDKASAVEDLTPAEIDAMTAEPEEIKPDGLVVIPASEDAFAEALGSAIDLTAAGEQARGDGERYNATFKPDIKPVSLPRVTSARPKPVDYLPPSEVEATVASWKEEAARQGRENFSANSQRTVISLFDASGVIAQPWIDAGYNVVSYDLQNGADINSFNAENLLETHGNDEVYAILAQPPCTDFAASGAQWWKAKDEDGRTEASNELVRQVLRTVELFRPPVWVMENPIGRIAEKNKLPEPLLSFDPWHYGDDYSKRTLLWGKFNPNLPTAFAEPSKGSKIHRMSSSAKYERSLTSEPFAYALFMANNAESIPLGQRLAQEFAGVEQGLFDAALKAGATERAIRTEIEDAYYDSDLETVRDALRDLSSRSRTETGTPPAPEQAQNAITEETRNDPAPEGPAPAVDRPVAEGPAPETPRRGAKQPRRVARRADDRGVREQGGLFEGTADEGTPLGDGREPDGVPARADGTVAGGVPGVPSRDYRPSPGGLTREGSWFATAARNIDLIELAIRIDGEKRAATPEEQAQLAKYVGFGASEIRNNLFPIPSPWQKAQDPKRLIWPDLVREARWKPLAERMAALPEEWQRSVLQSSQYAHYTSENVIRSVWSGLQRLGYTGGKTLEPGAGIGSFAMLMPDAVRATSRYTGIEFDGPTALIARLLSPDQNMLHEDFIKRKFPRDYFDLAIGNPPFSQTKVLADPDYEKQGFMLHDFFFAKSIDRVRPGGLLVFVTSKGTMDKQSDKARRYLAERADLLGAIRLPSTAFEDNAGTSVVTDVIFLRKRGQGEQPGGHAWQEVKGIETPDGPAAVNEYFAANPDMVLGQQRISGNVDDLGRRINSNGMGGAKYTVVSYDKTPAELDARFAQAIERLPENVYSAMAMTSEQLRRETAKVDFDPSVKREGVVYLGKDGALMRVENGVGRPLADGVKLSPKDEAWFKGYVGLREQVQLARAAQLADGDWEAALKRLNKAYDAFRKEFGPVNDFRVQVRKGTDEEGNEVQTEIRIFKNRRLFREDYDNAIVTQLETINEAGEIIKAPFLLGRTIGKPQTRTVKTVGDALAVSLDETGRLDLDDVARRVSITRDEAVEALGSAVYRTPGGEWQLADEYLSGDVVAKLEEAEFAARQDESLKRNVEALKQVQPEKLGPSQISVKLGASWVPVEHVNAFAKEIGAGRVKFDAKTESWEVEGGNMRSERKAGLEYGTADRSPSELLEAVLNSQSISIKRTDADKKTYTDQEATTAANEMARKIKDKFKGWVWTDSDRATELVELYNRRFNNIAPRRFDGSHLTLPGVSLRFSLHPHQKRAIWRQVQTGDTYLAHAVGAGKTIEMIAGGMEQKRLGLINKPIYAVPNHMLEQFANEFMELYPLANIMVADDENFSAERRKAFVAAATLNAPDAIIITHSAFERIGVKEETVGPIRDEILVDLEMELTEAKGDRVRRSQLQQQIEAVTQRFDSIAGVGKKDSTIKFEDIGADFVYVDEAHAFRKLDFTTNQKIKGIDPNGSRRALDMYVKTRHLQKQRPGRAMVFASGTPVTNTMGELYTIMRYFAPEELARAGISTFDAWARQFGEAVPALEANAAGRYEVVERFAKFDNVPELMSRVRQFMDVLTSEHLGALVKRPDIEGGKPDLITVEPTDALKAYMKGVLLPRLEKSRKWKPSKDEPFNPDPVIAITSDGRFAALDPRFVGETIDEDKTPTKLTRMADEVARIYHASAGNEYLDKQGKPEAIKGSTQIVFYNLGFGEQSMRNRGFDARGALNKRLVAQGVKREHILWFDDADTDAKKEAMFKAMRNGQARILVGSAKKMGTGVNVQKRLLALHYFDPPWYPSDVEQPHGRIIRQGNQNSIATIKWYATKGTYDSTMWQMVGRKQRFIDQAFSGDKTLRSMEDMSEASMFEQAAAVASGDPRALQLAGLRQDVDRLERLQAAHASEQINVRSALRSAEWSVESYEKRIKTYEAAFKAIGGRYFAFSSGKVGTRTYEKPGEFGQALKEAFNKGAADAVLDPGTVTRPLASIGDTITLRMEAMSDAKDKPTGEHELVLRAGAMDIQIAVGAAMGEQVDAVGLARRVFNAINGIETDLNRARASLATNETDVVRLRKKLGAPFEYQQELAEKIGDLKRLEDELRQEGEAEAREAAEAAVAKAREVKIDEEGNSDGDAKLKRGATGGMDHASAVALADQLAAGGLNRINVARSVSDLPAQPKRWIMAKAPDGRVRGAYLRGTDQVWLFTDNIRGADEFVEVALHEAFHRGLARTIPEAKPLLQQMWRSNTKLKQATSEKMASLGIARDEAIEEALADMAGRGEARDLSGWDKLLQLVRDWLGKIASAAGISMRWTDDMVADFVAGIRREGLQGGVHVDRGGVPAAENASLSRSFSGVMNDMREFDLPAKYKVGDLFDSDGKVHWWHKTVGTMHNLAEREPLFKRVYDSVQRFVGDVSYFATEAANQAPSILPKLEHWKDIAKSPIEPEDAKAIAAPIFEGTLTWMRTGSGELIRVADAEKQAAAMSADEKAEALLRFRKLDPKVLRMWQGLPLDQFEAAIETKYAKEMMQTGVVWSDAELRSMFNLNAEQIGLYREFRAAVDKSLADLSVSDMLRFGGDDVLPVRQQALATRDPVRASEILRDHLLERAEMEEDRADVLRDTANKLVDKANRAKSLMEHGYAPLSRFGQYSLDVVDENGQRVYFGLFESTTERSKMARQMRAQFPAATIETGTVSQEKYRLFAGVSPETLELFGEFFGLETDATDKASKAFQEWIKQTKSTRSAMRRLIERKGIEGFSEDAGRVLAGFVYSNARQTAANLHTGEITKAAADIQKTEGQLADQAIKLVEYVKNPQEEAQMIRGWLFAQYLGGSVASALVNMTQPATVTFPYLSQFGGVKKAAARMFTAARLAAKDRTGDDALDRALNRAEERGIVSPQEVHQLQAQAMGRATLRSGDGTALGNLTAKGLNKVSLLGFAWGKLFGMAEQVNRRVTFIAAYRTAVDEGMPDPEAFAARAVTETQFTYNKGNKPQWARGAVGSVLFTFKQYSISYVELMSRMWNQGEDGSPERAAGRKAVLLAMGVLLLAGGADGLPFMQDAEDVIDGILQRLGFNFSTKQAKREFLAKHLGEEGAQFVSKGISGLPGVPIDVSGRMGMGNLLPGTGFLVKKPDHTRDALEVVGPVGDLASRAFKAAGQLVDGDPGKAIETISPTAARNVAKAFDMASTGMYRDDRGRKVLDTDGYEALAKGLGFQPADVAKVQDATFQVQRMIAQNKMREAEIAEAWAVGIFEGDQKKVAEARADLARWNENNPTARIRIDMPQVLKRVRAMRATKAERIAKTAPREIRAQVRAELAEVDE